MPCVYLQTIPHVGRGGLFIEKEKKSIGRLYKNLSHAQTIRMKRIQIFDADGKTRDERETCFPGPTKLQRNRGQVRDDG